MDFNSLFCTSRPQPNLDLLATELILEILHYVILQEPPEYINEDLLSLSRTSWNLNAIVTPFLYEHNVKYMESSGLRWAVSHRDQHVMEQLVNRGASITSERSGYPLSIAVKSGDVNLLEFLLAKVSKDEIEKALSQGINDIGDTVLHCAILNADVPCVKALLNAGADMSILNARAERPIEYLFRETEEELVSRYSEIVKLLLARNSREFFKPILSLVVLEGPPQTLYHCDFIIGGRTTPLILAARRGAIEIVQSIIDAALRDGHNEMLHVSIRDGLYSKGKPALCELCDASKWPSDEEGCDKYLAGAKLLLLHGADPNHDTFFHNDAPLWLSCSESTSITHSNELLNIVRLQRDMVHLLISNNAKAGLSRSSKNVDEYFYPPMRFLDTAEYYTSSTAFFHSDEDETKQILQLLQETFQELLQSFKDHPAGLDKPCDMDHLSLLHRAATVPGTFGVHATDILLENGANINTKDKFGRDPIQYAIEKDKNRSALSLLRRWREMEKSSDASGSLSRTCE